MAYEQLLVNMFVVEPMAAWTSNRLRRLSLSPKRYFVDPAGPATALGLDTSAVLPDGDLLGRLLDTFVAAQLRVECASAESRPRLYHLREEHGRREVDVPAEIGGRDMLAFEVKAAAAPVATRPGIWRGCVTASATTSWGDHVPYGPALLELDERVTAAPIAALWGQA